jgi:hypothetical protein
MKKNQIIILVVLVVLIFGGIIGWTLIQKGKIPVKEEVTPKEEVVEELFSLSGIVSSVDAENNFLMVKPVNQEKEVKVVVSETTSLVKFEFPFDPANPPEEATFTPKQTQVEISDFKAGDNVFIKTRTNIAGKSEFDDVDFIHILP